jgi:hypothetical protein
MTTVDTILINISAFPNQGFIVYPPAMYGVAMQLGERIAMQRLYVSNFANLGISPRAVYFPYGTGEIGWEVA